jgi:hypothetical protein
MELKIEKDVNVSVQVNGKPFIISSEGKLWQNIENEKALLMIKTEDGTKEIKIQIVKK